MGTSEEKQAYCAKGFTCIHFSTPRCLFKDDGRTFSTCEDFEPALVMEKVDDKEVFAVAITRKEFLMLPTPTQRDYKDTGTLENVPENSLLPRVLGKGHGLKLQPHFVEWMMGFPVGWLDLKPSATPKSRNKSTRFIKQ